MGGTLSKPSFQWSWATGSKECPLSTCILHGSSAGVSVVKLLPHHRGGEFAVRIDVLHAIEASALEYWDILILNTIECIIKTCIVVLNSWEFDARCSIRATCTNIKCQREGDFHSKHDYFCLFISNCSKEL